MSKLSNKKGTIRTYSDARSHRDSILGDGENISISTHPQKAQEVARPRDLRSARHGSKNTFSRTSSARASLGATNATWYTTADCISENADNEEPRKRKSATLTIEYDPQKLKGARLVPVKCPFEVENCGYSMRPIFDSTIKRWWAVQIRLATPMSDVLLKDRDIICQMNGKEIMHKHRENLVKSIMDTFSESNMAVFGILQQNDFPSAIFDSTENSPSNALNSLSALGRSSRRVLSPMALHVKNLNAFNTRTIGQKFTVELIKAEMGGFGIGFATRDTVVNPSAGEPIFIDRIMPIGAAIEDGRLQFGDRLLAIDNIEVSSFESTLQQLRSIAVGGKVHLLFSRQETVSASPCASRSSTCFSPLTTLTANKSIPICHTFVFDIPVPLPESESSSIGVRLEWFAYPTIVHDSSSSPFILPSSSLDHTKDGRMVGDVFDDVEDLSGLFITNLTPGTPATAEECGVRTGDRLVAVNDQSIVGLSLIDVRTVLSKTIKHAQAKIARKHKPFFISLMVNRFFQSTEGMKTPIKSTLPSSSEENNRPLLELSQDGCKNRSPSVDSRSRSRRHSPPLSGSPDFNHIRSASSIFARDAMGRRSVSEKRHAHMNASSFRHFTENVLPHRACQNNDASRMYATMPASQSLRQLRKSKKARQAGPIKSVYRDEKPPSNSTQHLSDSGLMSDSLDVLRTDESHCSTPHEGDGANSQKSSKLHRSRPQNNSFRNAVDQLQRQSQPSPDRTPRRLSPAFDLSSSSPPPLPSRASKINPSNLDRSFSFAEPSLLASNPDQPKVPILPRKKSCPNSAEFARSHQNSPPVHPVPVRRSSIRRFKRTEDENSFLEQSNDQLSKMSNGESNKDLYKSSAVQHQKAFQELMGKGLVANRVKYKLSDAWNSSSDDQSSDQIILKNQTRIPDKDESNQPVDFNAYENRQASHLVEPVYIRPTIDHRRRTSLAPNPPPPLRKTDQYLPSVAYCHPTQHTERQPTGFGSKFLEEVETCLPKRRNHRESSVRNNENINNTPPAERFLTSIGRREDMLDCGYTSLPTRKSSREEYMSLNNAERLPMPDRARNQLFSNAKISSPHTSVRTLSPPAPYRHPHPQIYGDSGPSYSSPSTNVIRSPRLQGPANNLTTTNFANNFPSRCTYRNTPAPRTKRPTATAASGGTTALNEMAIVQRENAPSRILVRQSQRVPSKHMSSSAVKLTRASTHHAFSRPSPRLEQTAKLNSQTRRETDYALDSGLCSRKHRTFSPANLHEARVFAIYTRPS